ncbi:MAG: FHA domain-containing protein [Pirellulaceae bacterium]
MDVPILRFDRHSLPKPHSLPAAARVSLEITRGRVRQRTRQIASRVFLIGSANDCDLVLGDLQFPEAYAYVFVDGSDVSIRRLGSGPVLVVCDEELETSELFHGDLIEMGPFAMQVVIDHPPRRSPHDDDATHLRVAGANELAENLDAADEVRALLAEIRQTLAEDSVGVRLYELAPLEPAPSRFDAPFADRTRAIA